jgi:hypothetical protein
VIDMSAVAGAFVGGQSVLERRLDYLVVQEEALALGGLAGISEHGGYLPSCRGAGRGS